MDARLRDRLFAAMHEHAEWKDRLRHAIRGGPSIRSGKPQLEGESCELTQLLTSLANDPKIGEGALHVADLHRAFHALVAQVLTLQQTPEAAEELFMADDGFAGVNMRFGRELFRLWVSFDPRVASQASGATVAIPREQVAAAFAVAQAYKIEGHALSA